MNLWKHPLLGALASVACALSFACGTGDEPFVETDGSELEIGETEAGASAPPLSYLQAVKVTSTQGGTELISDSQMSTVKDHGGTSMRIFTKEIGYGCSRTATLGGVTLAQVSATAVLSGTTVVGYVREWKADGKTGGTFKYTSKSCNSPWNTKYDTLVIK